MHVAISRRLIERRLFTTVNRCIYSLCGSVGQICSARGCQGYFKGCVWGHLLGNKLLVLRPCRGTGSSVTAWRASCGLKQEEDESAPPSPPSGSILFPALWQAKAHVKWLLEFIHRGQRENKNITRELQLQPSNMTSVCF